MLDNLIRRLGNELKSPGNDRVARFEDVLGQIAALNDPACIGQLLPFFDDDEDFDEMMFSIVHAIEVFDDDTYTREIIRHVEPFYSKSPQWAITVHIRILNSPPTMAAYMKALEAITSEQRSVVKQVLDAVRREDTKFEARCELLLSTL